MLETVRTIYANLPSTISVTARLMFVFNQMADYHARDADLSRVLLRELVIPSSPERISDIAELMDVIFDGLTNIIRTADLAEKVDPALTARSAFALYYFALIGWLGSGFDRNWSMRVLRDQLSNLMSTEAYP
jgi:hypothetical protein